MQLIVNLISMTIFVQILTVEEAFVCPTSIVSDGDKTYNILESDTNKKVKKQRREQSTVKEVNTKKLSIPILLIILK